MTREILFRGKRVSDGEWVYGLPMDGFDSSIIIRNKTKFEETEYFVPYPVNPETVGQFTGLTDKNGEKIFEGDILMSYDCGDPLGTNVVFWDEQRCGWSDKRDDGDSQTEYDGFDFVTECKIIGNIHDNPDLLK